MLAIFLGGFLLIYRIIHSPFGEVLKAIRENEARAISLGYKTDRYKLVAFVLSATFAGLAGATKAIVFQLASLTDVDWPMSGEVVLMTLVGGLGTVFGPVAGAFFIIAMQNYLTQVGQWVTVVQGGSSSSACCCSAAASSASWRSCCASSFSRHDLHSSRLPNPALVPRSYKVFRYSTRSVFCLFVRERLSNVL